ncbi:hypothetical protein LXL04_038554 [Taraxacum kok-saghyz]
MNPYLRNTSFPNAYLTQYPQYSHHSNFPFNGYLNLDTHTHQRPVPGGRNSAKWSVDEDEVVILDSLDMYSPPPPPQPSFSIRTHQPLQFMGGRGHHQQSSEIIDEVVILENLNTNENSRLGGLTKEVISKNLKLKQINCSEEDDKDEICVICQVGFERKEMVGVLECKHCYHVECINEWLFHKNVCPLCKTRVFIV